MDSSIKIIPFCVPLTPGETNEVGVVGTVTLRGKSAIVWFGWGGVEQREAMRDCDSTVGDDTIAIGNGKPPMRSLCLSMPPPTRTSMMPTPTSQLLAGSSDEDMMLGQQMSARLAKRIGWPIFVSCSFSDFGQKGASPAMAAGFDDDTMPAALAEKEVTRILLRIQDELVAST